MNPKLFKGGKDGANTCKWIEDIEHLLNIAHDSKTSRFDSISYFLRDDTLHGFKNNERLVTL